MIISINCVPRTERRNTILATSIPSRHTRSLQLKVGAFCVSPRPPQPRYRLSQIAENSVLSTSTPPTGAEALALHLCRQHVPGFSIWDFEMRFSGCLRAMFGQGAFMRWIIGLPMGYGVRTRYGA